MVDKAEILATVPVQSRLKPSYFHSFGITENYVILIENPLVMNVLKLMTSKLRGKPTAGGLEWLGKRKVRRL